MAETQYKPPGLEAWDVVIVVLYFIVILGVGLYVSSSWHFVNNSAEREITCLACFSFYFENRVGNCWLLSAYIIILKHMYMYIYRIRNMAQQFSYGFGDRNPWLCYLPNRPTGEGWRWSMCLCLTKLQDGVLEWHFSYHGLWLPSTVAKNPRQKHEVLPCLYNL